MEGIGQGPQDIMGARGWYRVVLRSRPLRLEPRVALGLPLERYTSAAEAQASGGAFAWVMPIHLARQ
jgi:hypothetical protein